MNRADFLYFRHPWVGLLICLSLWTGSADAWAAPQRVRINLGTLAPRGSLYHQALQTMGESWKKESDGNIRLVVYPDGTQGGEADMVRLMRVGTLQAGLYTVVGLADIEPAVTGLQTLPMMFRTFEEFDFVNEKLRPRLEARLEEKGFIVLFWVDAGWVRYFSKEPMLSPQDLKSMKLFVWAGNAHVMDVLKAKGLHPVAMETGEMLTGLQTGLIDVVTAPPIFALASQVDLKAPHMLELNWALLVGAAVIKKETWNMVAPEIKTNLLKSARTAGRQIQAKSREENVLAVAAMKKRGLTVHLVPPQLEEEWRKSAESLYPDFRGELVPADIFDEVQQLLREYRAGPGKAQP